MGFWLMSEHSKIEWTDATWNPIRGCVKVSPGCAHCYAETLAERFRGVPGHPFERGFDPRPAPDQLEKPLTWMRPRRVFVCSMSDLFQQAVDKKWLARIFGVMMRAHWHTFQVLTKRAGRMAGEFVSGLRSKYWLDHVWWGVSVEDQQRRHRIDTLRLMKAANRFLSLEPLLENLGPLNLQGIGWVIVGGESGRGARPMDPDWVRSIRDQCGEAGVPFFFKQWGGVRKAAAGRELDGRTHDDLPGVMTAHAVSR